MSQSPARIPRDSPDDDVLSFFDPEPQAASQPLPPEDSAPITTVAAVTSPDCPSVEAALAAKLDDAVREIERTNGEVTALRAELATIVARVRDIDRRVGRDAAQTASRKPVVAAPERHRLLKAAALALLVLANAMLWQPASAPSTIDRVQPIASPSVPLVTVAARVAPIDEPLAPVDEPLAPVATAPVSARPIPIRVSHVAPEESREPRPFLGTLAVQTAPAGAEVFVNQRSVGTTPLRLPALRAGSHLLWIKLDGYQRWTRVVTVPADQITSVSAQLERQQ